MADTLSPELDCALHGVGLRAAGCVSSKAGDGLGPEIRAVLLLSPAEDFWSTFRASLEYADARPDPMDRWSLRVISELAKRFGTEAYFPFETEAPPAPFFRWGQDSGRAWPSPVLLLVGADMGLNLSFRGALGFAHDIDLPHAMRPCETCARPCVSVCPAGAVSEGRYDVEQCKTYLRSDRDAPCLAGGCVVRNACPASRRQHPEATRFHMEAFLA